MPTFSIRGFVTSIDQCAIEGMFHPSVVLRIDVNGAFTDIIIPDGVLRQAKDVVVGTAVNVSGEVLDFPAHRVHFATELKAAPPAASGSPYIRRHPVKRRAALVFETARQRDRQK